MFESEICNHSDDETEAEWCKDDKKKQVMNHLLGTWNLRTNIKNKQKL
jgi:hypothetical protein